VRGDLFIIFRGRKGGKEGAILPSFGKRRLDLSYSVETVEAGTPYLLYSWGEEMRKKGGLSFKGRLVLPRISLTRRVMTIE